jgi:hypothetical protein
MSTAFIDFSTKFYSVTLSTFERKTQIVMHFNTPQVTTHAMPHVARILKSDLPSIYAAKCFNEFNLPFSQEMNATELGHLYEHILLEYLADLTLQHKKVDREYSGITEWNWKTQKKGTFYISVDIGLKDRSILLLGLARANHLIEKILTQSSNIS